MSDVPKFIREALLKKQGFVGVVKPTHYCWVFDPRTGLAHINSDDHDKPLRLRGYHQEIAEGLGRHPELIRGNAHRASGGWLICDLEGNAVDVFINNQIIKAINERESSESTSEAPQAWHFDP